MIEMAARLADRCADRLLQIANASASSAPQAALLLRYTFSGVPEEPLTASVFVVLDSERETLREALRAASDPNEFSEELWARMWDAIEYPDWRDREFYFADFEADFKDTAVAMHRSGSEAPDQEFWPQVARRLNAGPRPIHATENWCAVAIDFINGSDRYGEIAESVPPELLQQLLDNDYLG